MKEIQSEILIIGAGISGLLAGKILSQAGIEVKILEKSRGVGGRMSTRRFHKGIFDHGAQFFTSRNQEFRQWIEKWKDAGAVESWFGNQSAGRQLSTFENHTRFIGVNGMTSVPKQLAKELGVHTGTLIKAISMAENYWIAESDNGDRYSASAMILSAPIPQSLKLLEAGDVTIPMEEAKTLLSIEYDPCIAGLILLENASKIPPPGGMKFREGQIQWLGDNTQKGISPEATAVTVHASADFSRKNFDKAEAEIADLLIAEASPWLGSKVLDWQIHKWRYSKPGITFPAQYFETTALDGLYMIGDGFGGAKVEGAALSGMKLAAHLQKKMLSNRVS
jgi:predicted NAD/FAD-dependent oxidoreductase